MNLFIGHIEGKNAILSAEEAHHMHRVLRMKVGDGAYVTNGSGDLYNGIIQELNSKHAVIGNLQAMENLQRRSYTIELAVAPTKQMDRTEYFLEKSIELGLDAYHPIISFHSERRKLNLDRLNRISLAAMKQSLKAEQTAISDLEKFEKFVMSQRDFKGQKFIAHCHDEIQRESIKTIMQPEDNYQFLIGPEGDFSEEEIRLAMENGYVSISLGNQRMRTETAALSCVMFAHWLHL